MSSKKPKATLRSVLVPVPSTEFNRFIIEQVQVMPERDNQADPKGVHIVGGFDTPEEAMHFVSIHKEPSVLMWWRPISKLAFGGRKDNWPKKKKR